MEVVDKPVIYVYSEEPTACRLKINPHSEFTFTYPKHDEGWSFTTTKEGQLKTEKGHYPYLFWEGKTSELTFQKLENKAESYQLNNAFQVNTDSTISFLEHQLTALGLNNREKTDFITFWGPKMIQHQYALIQFLVDDEYESVIANMEMEPVPESSLRVFMLFASMDHYSDSIETTPPAFNPLERKGLTIVEWGGSNIQLPLMPNL